MLLGIGTKLEVIITRMCLEGNEQATVVPGIVGVEPKNGLFWFGKPRLLLHLIQFILVQVFLHINKFFIHHPSPTALIFYFDERFFFTKIATIENLISSCFFGEIINYILKAFTYHHSV